MLMSKITIACVLRTPDQNVPEPKKKRYGPDDVLKLKKAFETFLSIDHDFVCLTDQEISEIKTIPLIGNTPGWWAKIELFRPDLFNGPVFYFDLDTIICGELDSVIPLFKDEKFLMINKGSSFMYWNGDYSHLWKIYLEKYSSIWKQYSKKPNIGDQAFIYDHIQAKEFCDVVGFDKEWIFEFNSAGIPPEKSKILQVWGMRNKFHKDGFKNHPWVKKYWTDIL
jgi:hypothetical protein